MRRLGAVAGAVVVALAGAGAGAAQADHRPILGEVVVEGAADYRALPGSGLDFAYVCSAQTSGDMVASTAVTCEVRQGKEVKSSIARANSSNLVVADPRVVTLAEGPFEICWTAYAWTTHGEFVYDVSEPNCVSGEAVAS